MKNKKLLHLKTKIKEIFGPMNNRQKKYVSWLYELATRDEKTELYNNKFFESILGMEMEKAQRGYGKLCLFIIDIDFFKKINDKYGHIKADELLKKLASVLKKQLRKSDIAARFGGEEFFVLLPETDLDKAKKIISRFKASIKSDKTLRRYGITVSGGLTQYKEKDTEKSFKERADKALYTAKKTGRNKFVVLE